MKFTFPEASGSAAPPESAFSLAGSMLMIGVLSTDFAITSAANDKRIVGVAKNIISNASVKLSIFFFINYPS